MDSTDPVALTQALVRCASVTPADAGALDVVRDALTGLGFVCHEVPGEGPPGTIIRNVYAKLGDGPPALAFAGHTDVVPPGDASAWRYPPFAGEIADGRLWGRGAADMKSGVAAQIAGVARYLRNHGAPPRAVAFLVTGDEEGPATGGTPAMLAWMRECGEVPEACVLAEPTSLEAMGDMIKIGRRGTFNGELVVHGRQGHTAYPHRADNAAHRIVKMLDAITRELPDQGTDQFQPTTLQVSTIDIGNPAGNVIPARATARFNIRYSPLQTPATLERWLRERLDAAGGTYELTVRNSGDAFLTERGPLTERVTEAVREVTGRDPDPSTSGGTSDARFIKDLCPVVEVGLVGTTMHQTDEHVRLEDIETLTRIFEALLRRTFGGAE